MIARPKLIHLMGVILSPKKIKARMAVETGRVSISKAALLASDIRVPQVIRTCPGNTPSEARRKKIRMSLLFRGGRLSLLASQRISG
jgi:hypothetical protein